MEEFFINFKKPITFMAIIILSILLRKIINVLAILILLISFRAAFLTKIEEYKVSTQMGFFSGLLVLFLFAITHLEGGIFRDLAFPNIFTTGEVWKFILIGFISGFLLAFFISNFKNAILVGFLIFLITFIGAVNLYLHMLSPNIKQVSLIISGSLLLGILIFIMFLPNKMKYFQDLLGLTET